MGCVRQPVGRDEIPGGRVECDEIDRIIPVLDAHATAHTWGGGGERGREKL